MNKELMIIKEDLVNWLDRPPSNDDLDLIDFITTRLENFYKLKQENKKLNRQLDQALKDYDEEMQKNMKAIEYIEKTEEKNFSFNYEYGLTTEEIENLLKILKGEDNE